MSVWARRLLALGAVCLASCNAILDNDEGVLDPSLAVGGSSSGSGSGKSNSVTEGDVCDRTGQALCRRYEACQLSDYASCVQLWRGVCCESEGSCFTLLADVDAARTAEAACVSGFSRATCNELTTGSATCD